MNRILSTILVAATGLPLAGGPYEPIQPFLNRYCVECHGADKQKGEVRLDDFRSISGALWSEIYDQIHHADMPPEDELQPSKKERAEITRLVHQISRDETFSISTGYRRLNRREYSNTVRDLLGLKPGIFDPAARIFRDEIDEGFDTNAAELVISNELLLEYLESAERSLRMALYFEDLAPPLTTATEFNPGKLHGGDRRYTTNKRKSTVLRTQGQYFPNQDSRRVAVAGNYRVTITAAGVDRDTYGKMKFAPQNGPIKMGIGARLDSPGQNASSQLIKAFDLNDEKFEDYEVILWLEKGAYPWVGFLNGLGKPAATIRQAIRQGKVDSKKLNTKNYQGPGVEVTRFKVEGPLDPEWPPASYRTVFLSDEMPDFKNAGTRDTLLKRFVTRAYRRPATEIEIDDFRGYLKTQYQKSQDWQEAFIKTFAAVMASHDFLYLKEKPGPLPPFTLASRLSYFLWSTMPDMELFQLAFSDELQKPEVFSAQVKRMLEDPRAGEFVRGFATQWLSLDLLGSMPPDVKDRRYAAYHKRGYEAAFTEETLQYFRHVLFENQPIGDFLDSDYTFINKTLAEVYDLPFKGGADHQRVTLPRNSVRGGLLGHGSILALTSNGVETLPVTRGHWILDELLGTPPPPPPPEEVPALVPDLNGVDTPRDQLVRHREDPACFKCHQEMDPLGLALENFDVIGRYRTKYPSGPKIDPAGELLGKRFKNVAELRKILRNHEGEFAKSLTIKLAEYAKGRRLNRSDLELVDQITKQSGGNGYRFRDLLLGILQSNLMKHR